jgi:uncharacterized protein
LRDFAGPDKRVYLASGLPWFGGIGIPEQHSLYIREGYEELMRLSTADARESQPKYGVRVESGVMMPMRDGVKLSTDLYMPEGIKKALLILVRTPYKKESEMRRY